MIALKRPEKTQALRVERLYQPGNHGCKPAVGAGIDWFLAHEDSGITLEDHSPSASAEGVRSVRPGE